MPAVVIDFTARRVAKETPRLRDRADAFRRSAVAAQNYLDALEAQGRYCQEAERRAIFARALSAASLVRAQLAGAM